MAVATLGGTTNGLIGAWGPVVTPYLLQIGVAPRYVVGTVNTAEIAVAVVAAGSLLGSLGGAGVSLAIVVAMLAGGVVAAPLAAVVIRIVPPRALGVAVAGLLLATQARELTTASGELRLAAWIAVAVAVGWAALRPAVPDLRRRGSTAAATVPTPDAGPVTARRPE